ncbi:hypothetical protein [Rhizocola hellebori]|nr:hypothetical protein [Rhizocola hellebori]
MPSVVRPPVEPQEELGLRIGVDEIDQIGELPGVLAVGELLGHRP